MILISDSGATKADWIALDDKGNQLFLTSTLGLNPEVINREIILERLNNNTEFANQRSQVSHVYFYGAGCGTKRMQDFLKDIFETFFSNAELISIKEDTYGAVFSTININEPAVVCILGTGSNCCYWDGKELHQKVESLGYILMDDCSGNYFGKQLIRDYYFNNMPSDISDLFAEKYDLNADSIKENIYKLPNPNKYLAHFARFIIERKNHPYFQKIIREGFSLFIKNYILQFEQSRRVPVHFVGSIAFYLQDELKAIMTEMNLNTGNIIKKPIDGMVSYYRQNFLFK